MQKHQPSSPSIQSDQQETKSRVLPHLLFYRNVFLSWISRFYLLAVDSRFVGCLPLKNLSLRVTDTGEVFQFCHLYNAATNTQ
jgi:hypothetical protein